MPAMRKASKSAASEDYAAVMQLIERGQFNAK